MKMDILKEAKNLPYEPEREWIERVKDNEGEMDNHFEWDKEYLNPLRKLCKKAEEKFAEHIPEHVDYFSRDDLTDRVIGENTGMEVEGKMDWKRLRKKIPDKQLYDFVLFEGITVHLVFYQRIHGVVDQSLDEYAERIIDDKNVQDHTKEVAKTYLWLKEKDLPEELNVKQDRLSDPKPERRQPEKY